MMETTAAEATKPVGKNEHQSGSLLVGGRNEGDLSRSLAQKSGSPEGSRPLGSAEAQAGKTGESSKPEEAAADTDRDEQSEEKEKPKGETKAAPAVGNVLRGTKEDLIRGPNHKPTFAEQLYDALEDEEHHDVLQWTPNGKAFTITNHKKFTLYKMSKLFNIRNMSSFVRKLGRWGFTRVHEKQSNNSDIFKHPEFVRGDRALVKRKVKCMGRLIAAASGAAQQQRENVQQQLRHDRDQMQQIGMGGLALGAPLGGFHSVVHPNTSLRGEIDLNMPMRSYEGALPFHNDVPLNDSNTGSASMLMEPSLDRVTDASAASAEALFLSHTRSQQQSKMDLLAQQDQLNEREIQNLLLQRERQQRELEAQKRRIIWEQQQLAQEAARRSSVYSGGQQEQFQMPMSSALNAAGMRSGLSDLAGNGMARSGGGAMSQDMGFSGGGNMRSATTMDQQLLFDLEEQQRRQVLAIQDRRALLADHSQHSGRDDTISQSMTGIQTSLPRHSMGAAAVAERGGGSGQSLRQRYSMDGAASGMGGSDMMASADQMGSFQGAASSGGEDARAQQRKAVIQALLREEQEWEMKRRAEGTGGMGGMEQQQQQSRMNQQQQQFFPQQSQLQQNSQQFQQSQIRQQQMGMGQQQNQQMRQQQQMGMGQQQQNQLLQQQQQDPSSQLDRMDPRVQLRQLEQLKLQQQQQQLQMMQQQQQMRRGQQDYS